MNEKTSGFIRLPTVRGVPILIHWSVAAGWLWLAVIVQFSMPDVIYFCSSYTFLIVCHEAGHAVAAHCFGLKVYEIRLSGLGGRCRFQRPGSRAAALTVVSGGLLAQLLVLAIVLLYLAFAGFPSSHWFAIFVDSCTLVNALLVITNLIPVKRSKGLSPDGYLIWVLLRQWWKGSTYSYPDTSKAFDPGTKLLSVKGFKPKDFTVGIEILNDNSTPMNFVVEQMQEHLGISREKAIELMLSVHNSGGLLIPMPTFDAAQKAATEMTASALKAGHAFTCRPVAVYAADTESHKTK